MFRTYTVLGGVLALSLVGAAESFGVPSDPPTVDVNVVNMEADAVPVVVQNAVDVMSQSVQPVTSGDDVFNDVSCAQQIVIYTVLDGKSSPSDNSETMALR